MASKTPETIAATIRRVHELVERGATEGERDAARIQLERLLKKHDLTLEQVMNEEPKEYLWTWTTVQEKTLLIHIFGYVTGKGLVYFRENKRYRRLWFKLTTAQKIDFDLCWETWRSAWKDELATLILAFLSANEIFGSSDGGETGAKEYTPKEWARILRAAQMRDTIKRTSPRKRLQKGD